MKQISGLTAIFILIMGIVFTVYANQDDGRINVGPHVGGHVVYCVDANDQPADHYSEGGIKILGTYGKELLRVDGATLSALVAAAQAGEGNQLAGSVPGPYGFGDLSLWVLSNGQFAVIGYDEHGKVFEFVWEGCIPVVYGSGSDEESGSSGGGVVETEEPSFR